MDIENNFEDPDAELNIETFKIYIRSTEHEYLTAQSRLCFAIVARIYRRVLDNYYFGDVKVDGDMIVEGNHRYIAYKLAKIQFEIIKGTRSHIDQVKKFNEIQIETIQDWDANHHKTKKYCNDDFLKDGRYLRNN